jgi:hypothetical protein
MSCVFCEFGDMFHVCEDSAEIDGLDEEDTESLREGES